MRDEQEKKMLFFFKDFAKASKKYDHLETIYKMRTKETIGKLGSWVYNFLTNRS